MECVQTYPNMWPRFWYQDVQVGLFHLMHSNSRLLPGKTLLSLRTYHSKFLMSCPSSVRRGILVSFWENMLLHENEITSPCDKRWWKGIFKQDTTPETYTYTVFSLHLWPSWYINSTSVNDVWVCIAACLLYTVLYNGPTCMHDSPEMDALLPHHNNNFMIVYPCTHSTLTFMLTTGRWCWCCDITSLSARCRVDRRAT